MAKANVKAKATSKAKSNTTRRRSTSRAPVLPAGYKVVSRAPNWDVDKHPVVEGERGEAKSVTMKEGTKDEYTVRTFILQDEEQGAVTIWESTGLRDLFDQSEEGDTVRIEFLGYGIAKKGQSAPKLFSCGVAD